MQESLERPVAIKILAQTQIDDPLCRELFDRESRLIARLNHPNIVQVIDQGQTEDGLPFFVMPYVKSISLAAVLQRTDVALTRKLDILIQIAAALAYAHRNGVLHRDIKPANVLVDYEGHVRLVDFGIAGFFDDQQDAVAGTQAYMAPEQHQGLASTSQQTDLYAFGVLMHELLYGLRPDAGSASAQVGRSHEQYPQLKKLHPLIMQCLEPDATKRPASALVLREQLLLTAAGKHLASNRWGLEAERDKLPPNYTLLDVLKEDPVSATYLVNDPNKGRLLVIKKQSLEHQDRAARCSAKLTQIHHPHIARIFGTGKNQRVFITVTEYLPAGSLADRLSQALAAPEWHSMALQLFNALACAHSYGLIHGNLRPSNILFATEHQLKLSDFGYDLHTGRLNRYLPADATLTTATDLYSAGAVLFESLTGQHHSNRFWQLMDRWRLRRQPKALRTLLLSLLHRNARKRPSSAGEVAQQFAQWSDQQATQISASPKFKR